MLSPLVALFGLALMMNGHWFVGGALMAMAYYGYTRSRRFINGR